MPVSAPPIDEAVYLLSKYKPEILNALRLELPELGPYLEPSGLAGPASPQIVARAKVCAATQKETVTLCNMGIANAEGRLRRQKTLALVGGVIATAASASVVASLSAAFSGVALAGGVISLVGSLAALLSEHIGKIPRKDMSLFDAYNGLSESRASVQLLMGDLKSHLLSGPQEENEAEIAAIIGKSDELFRKVHDILSALEVASGSK